MFARSGGDSLPDMSTSHPRSLVRAGWLAPAALALVFAVSACAPEEIPAPVEDPPPAVPEVVEAEQEEEEEEETQENPGYDQATLDDLLRQAAWANDLESAERLISWGADVNAKDSTEQSAYLVATSEGHLELLRLTLAHGADVNSLDSWVGTGLIRAAERGHWDVVGELLQSGVPRDHVNRVGYQAIHEAVWFGRDDATYQATVRVLFAGGVDFSHRSGQEGLTPLEMADSRGFGGQGAVIRSLLEAPVPEDPAGALLQAAAAGDVTAAAAALRAGADPASTDPAGDTAHAIAAAAGHVNTAQLIRALDHTVDAQV